MRPGLLERMPLIERSLKDLNNDSAAAVTNGISADMEDDLVDTDDMKMKDPLPKVEQVSLCVFFKLD